MPECCCCIRLHAPIHKRNNGGINDPGKGRRVFQLTLCKIYFTLEFTMCCQHSQTLWLQSQVWEQAKFWEMRRIFARILQNLPEKNSKKMTSEKPLNVLSCAIFFKSKHMGCTYTLAPPPSAPMTSMPWINQKRTFYPRLDSTPNILNDETWGRWLCLDAGYENEALFIPCCRKASVSLQLSHALWRSRMPSIEEG